MILIPILALLLILVAVLLFRTARFGVHTPPVGAVELADVSAERAAEKLSRAVQIATISHDSIEKVDKLAFWRFQSLLEEMFPRLHAALKRETICELSLLYTWEGTDPALKPILLTSHQDVVPVEEGTEALWEHPPFSGDIAEGFIWGRGTMDIKSGVIGIMEAVEWLLEQGYQPQRTVYLAFGHDEEVLGVGAPHIAAALAARGVELEYVLDEGGSVVEGMISGVQHPVALIGVTEKGYMTLELSVEIEGGHSSMPKQPTAIGLLSRAVKKLEENPLPVNLTSAMPLFTHLGAYLPFGMRLIFANLWLFAPLVRRQLAANYRTNAAIRTTTAVTLFHSGMKENVLPRSGVVTVNFRLLPGDTVEGVVERVKRIIDDDRVQVRVVQHHGVESLPKIAGQAPLVGAYASPATADGVAASAASAPFQTLAETIQQVFPGAVTAPFLVLGGTDARHYSPLSPCVFRFSPFHVTQADMARVHGLNERLSVENMQRCVQFFVQLIRITS